MNLQQTSPTSDRKLSKDPAVDKLMKRFFPLFVTRSWRARTDFGDCSHVSPGWRPIIYQLFNDIEALLPGDEAHIIKIGQLKEKFGVLRLSVGLTSTALRDVANRAKSRQTLEQVRALAQAASEQSARVCIQCGTASELRKSDSGWLSTMCDRCRHINAERMKQNDEIAVRLRGAFPRLFLPPLPSAVPSQRFFCSIPAAWEAPVRALLAEIDDMLSEDLVHRLVLSGILLDPSGELEVWYALQPRGIGERVNEDYFTTYRQRIDAAIGRTREALGSAEMT